MSLVERVAAVLDRAGAGYAVIDFRPPYRFVGMTSIAITLIATQTTATMPV